MDTSRSPDEEMRRRATAAGDGESGNDAVVSDSRVGEETDRALTELLLRTRGPLDWRTLPAHDAVTVWGELRDWVGWLRAEFGFDHRVVPPCWYRHRALVSVLSALHDHWLAAYDPMSSLAGAGEWHRGLIQLEARLREWASRTGCSLGEHREDIATAYPPDHEAWRAHLAGDMAARQASGAATATADRWSNPGCAADPARSLPAAAGPEGEEGDG